VSAITLLKQDSKKIAGRRRIYFSGMEKTIALLMKAMRIESEPVKFNIQGAASLTGCCGLSSQFEIPQYSKE
jgi:hypothetical protein